MKLYPQIVKYNSHFCICPTDGTFTSLMTLISLIESFDLFFNLDPADNSNPLLCKLL